VTNIRLGTGIAPHYIKGYISLSNATERDYEKLKNKNN